MKTLLQPTRLLAVILLGAACRPAMEEPAPPEPTPEEIRAAIDAELDATYARFEDAYAAADADRIADIYHERAYYIAPQQELIQGRQAIRDHYGRFLDGMRQAEVPGPELSFEVVDREVDGELATDVGFYTLRQPWDPSDDPGARGTFLVVWQRGPDGYWRMLAEAFAP